MASKWATVEKAAPREKDSDTVWAEAFRQVREAANYVFQRRIEFTTAATGVLTTAWLSDPLPKGTTVTFTAEVIGKSTDVSRRAAYRRIGCFYRATGAAAQQGATQDAYAPFETDAALDAQIGVDANSCLFVKVNDGALATMNWTVYVEVRRL